MASQAEAVSGDRPGSGVLPRGGQALALTTLCTVLFLTFLDNTVVSVALGDIQVSLKANVTELQWVIGAYALTFASIMLACGMIGDELGRKKVMLAGVGVFCGGSVLCALAPNVQTLIAGRAVMGLGAAASEPGTLSMLRHLYPDERARSRAIGVWAGVSGFALAAGPVVGGVLTGLWSWRSIFWFNLVFGLAALIVAAVSLPESADPTAARVDTAGTILGAGALATFVFAVIDAESAGFRLGRRDHLAVPERGAVRRVRLVGTPVPAPAARPALPARAAVHHGQHHRVLHLLRHVRHLLLHRAVPERGVTASGYRLAAVFLPMTVLMIAASVLAGRWTAAAGPRWSITTGCVLFAAGLILTDAFLSPHPNYPALTAALALAGIGIGTTVVPITTSVLSAVPPERSGMAASASNTSREIGAVVGVAVLGSLVYSQLHASLVAQMNHLGVPKVFQGLVINAIETGQIPQNTGVYSGFGKLVQEVIGAAYTAFHDGLRAALYLSAALVLVAALLAFITLRSRPVNTGS